MTIHLPENLESSVLEAVHSGHFASVDEAMAEAARLLLQNLNQAQAGANMPADAPQSILEMVDELRRKVPPKEFSKLPTDGAKQLDHYLYGSPKRPTA